MFPMIMVLAVLAAVSMAFVLLLDPLGGAPEVIVIKEAL